MRTRTLPAAVLAVGLFAGATLAGCTSYTPQQFLPQANEIAKQVIPIVENWFPKLANKPNLEDAKKEALADWTKAFKDKWGQDKEPSKNDISGGQDAINGNAQKKVDKFTIGIKNGFIKEIQGISLPKGLARGMFIYATCGDLVASSGDKPSESGFAKGPKVKLADKDASCNDGTRADPPKAQFTVEWKVGSADAKMTIVLWIK